MHTSAHDDMPEDAAEREALDALFVDCYRAALLGSKYFATISHDLEVVARTQGAQFLADRGVTITVSRRGWGYYDATIEVARPLTPKAQQWLGLDADGRPPIKAGGASETIPDFPSAAEARALADAAFDADIRPLKERLGREIRASAEAGYRTLSFYPYDSADTRPTKAVKERMLQVLEDGLQNDGYRASANFGGGYLTISWE